VLLKKLLPFKASTPVKADIAGMLGNSISDDPNAVVFFQATPLPF
jgi:hypothetical protein